MKIYKAPHGSIHVYLDGWIFRVYYMTNPTIPWESSCTWRALTCMFPAALY